MARFIGCLGCGKEIHPEIKTCDACYMKKEEKLLIKVVLICVPLVAFCMYMMWRGN